MNAARWAQLLQSLGITAETTTFAALEAAYTQTHRAYHTVRHIDDCLTLLDEMRGVAQRAAEIEMALWFHDAIYDPMGKANEERSAGWAIEFGKSAGLTEDALARIRSHILATRHDGHAQDDDSKLTVDIDLSILGAAPERYAEFERDVRREYRWVPSILFRTKRAHILQSFLDRPWIYHFAPLQERFEQRARMNLTNAIATLQGRA